MTLDLSPILGVRGEAELGFGRAGRQPKPSGGFGSSGPGSAEGPRLAGAGAGKTGREAPTARANTEGSPEAAGQTNGLTNTGMNTNDT